MIVIVDNTYLDFDKVNSILLNYEENKTMTSNVKWWNPFSWFDLPTVSVDPKYVLKMEYVRGSDTWHYTVSSTDVSKLRDQFKKIVEQLKMQVDVQNQEMLDKLFEQALNLGGSK